MRLGNIIFNTFIPLVVRILGAKPGSWKEKKYTVVLQSLIMIPLNRIRGIRRISEVVEEQYDEISGLYINDNYYKGRMRYSVVDGKVENISSIDNMKLIRREMYDVLKTIKFKNVLEVGVGELTTLESVYDQFGPDINMYGIDLSANRIYNGLIEYRKRHKLEPVVIKGNAIRLPFPDNCFDLVYTRHTLEQMPTIYKSAIAEIIRVSKQHIILFEPSFELAAPAQKIKMLNSDYVRGIMKYLKKTKGVLVKKFYLMKNSANPLNHTACYQLELTKRKTEESSAVKLVCPKTRSPLILKDGYYLSKDKNRAFPIIEGIPILDYDYSVKISKLDE